MEAAVPHTYEGDDRMYNSPPDDNEVQSLLQVVRELEESRRDAEGNPVAIIQIEEKLLPYKKELVNRGFLPEKEVHNAAEKLCVGYNAAGVRCFKSDKHNQAATFLQRAMKLTEERPGAVYFSGDDDLRLRLRATTLNNLGCMERRRGNNEAALKHLTLSSQIERNSSATTSLNISAILTQLSRHQEAIGTARRAVGLLTQVSKRTAEESSLLAIAYHNLAMAQESSSSLEDKSDAVESYAAAVSTAGKELGKNHQTTIAVKKAMIRAQKVVGSGNQLNHSNATWKSRKINRNKKEKYNPTSTGGSNQSRTKAMGHSGYELSNSPPATKSSPNAQHDRNVLPLISPLPQVSQSPDTVPTATSRMMSANQLQQELNPDYSADTGMILTERGADNPTRDVSQRRRKGKGKGKVLTTGTQASRMRRLSSPKMIKGEANVSRESMNQSSGNGPPVVPPQPPQKGVGAMRPTPPTQPLQRGARKAPQGAPSHSLNEKQQHDNNQQQHSKNTQQKKEFYNNIPHSSRGGSGGHRGQVVTSNQQIAEVTEHQSKDPIQQRDGGEYSAPQHRKEKSEPTKQRNIRRHDDLRDDDKRKEDALTYMNQLLVKLLKDEDSFEQQFQAALRIQCSYRSMSARLLVEKNREIRTRQAMSRLYRENESAKKITKFIRYVSQLNSNRRRLEHEAMVEFQQRSAAATSIQRQARGWLARRNAKRLRTYYTKMNWAVCVIQCFTRRVQASIKIKSLRQRKQQVWKQRLETEKKRCAAVRVQKVFRGYRARLLADTLRGRIRRQHQLDGEALRQHAATQIRASWKGYRSRQLAKSMRATRIRTRELRERIEYRNYSITTIQRCWRGHLGYTEAKHSQLLQRNERERSLVGRRIYSIVAMQCFIKRIWAMRCVRRLRQERKKRVASQASNHYATVISSCWKGYLARVETKHRHTILDSLQNDRVAEINAAAVKLQASTRGYLTRKDQKRKEAEILRENEIKKHLPKALREEQLTVDQDMIHSDYNNIKIISPKRNILSKEEMLGSLFETNRGGLSFVIESSLTRVPLLSELSEVFNLPPPPPPSVEFKTLTGSAVTFKIEDNLPVVYVDSLFSHYATKVIYDASTRYITLERTIPCGEDTVQICGTSLPTILTGIIDVCEASDLKHNLCGQSQILEEQSVHVLQRATRRFKAKQLVHQRRVEFAEEVELEIRSAAVKKLQQWAKARNMRRKFASLLEGKMKSESERMVEEDREFAAKAAQQLAGYRNPVLCNRQHSPSGPQEPDDGNNCTKEDAQEEPEEEIGFQDLVATRIVVPDFDISAFLAAGGSTPQSDLPTSGAGDMEAETEAEAATKIQSILRGNAARNEADRRRVENRAAERHRQVRIHEEDFWATSSTIHPPEEEQRVAEDQLRILNYQREQKEKESHLDRQIEEGVNEGALRYLESLKHGNDESVEELVVDEVREDETNSPHAVVSPQTATEIYEKASPISKEFEKVNTKSVIEAENEAICLRKLQQELVEEQQKLRKPKPPPGKPVGGSRRDSFGDVSGISFMALNAASEQSRVAGSSDPVRRWYAACVIQRMCRYTAARVLRRERAMMIMGSRQLEVQLESTFDTNDQEAAAIRIQGLRKIQKSKAARQQKKEELEKQIESKATFDLRELQNEAAARIQRQVRKRIAECDVADTRRYVRKHIRFNVKCENRIDRSAVTIQCAWRCSSSRKRRSRHQAEHLYTNQSLHRDENATAIQRVWRGHQTRKHHCGQQANDDPQNLKNENEAAEAIQRSYRIHAARSERQKRKQSRESQRRARFGSEKDAKDENDDLEN